MTEYQVVNLGISETDLSKFIYNDFVPQLYARNNNFTPIFNDLQFITKNDYSGTYFDDDEIIAVKVDGVTRWYGYVESSIPIPGPDPESIMWQTSVVNIFKKYKNFSTTDLIGEIDVSFITNINSGLYQEGTQIVLKKVQIQGVFEAIFEADFEGLGLTASWIYPQIDPITPSTESHFAEYFMFDECIYYMKSVFPTQTSDLVDLYTMILNLCKACAVIPYFEDDTIKLFKKADVGNFKDYYFTEYTDRSYNKPIDYSEDLKTGYGILGSKIETKQNFYLNPAMYYGGVVNLITDITREGSDLWIYLDHIHGLSTTEYTDMKILNTTGIDDDYNITDDDFSIINPTVLQIPDTDFVANIRHAEITKSLVIDLNFVIVGGNEVGVRFTPAHGLSSVNNKMIISGTPDHDGTYTYTSNPAVLPGEFRVINTTRVNIYSAGVSTANAGQMDFTEQYRYVYESVFGTFDFSSVHGLDPTVVTTFELRNCASGNGSKTYNATPSNNTEFSITDSDTVVFGGSMNSNPIPTCRTVYNDTRDESTVVQSGEAEEGKVTVSTIEDLLIAYSFAIGTPFTTHHKVAGAWFILGYGYSTLWSHIKELNTARATLIEEQANIDDTEAINTLTPHKSVSYNIGDKSIDIVQQYPKDSV